jgi:cytochrome o ubiquinol oxidase subunit 2
LLSLADFGLLIAFLLHGHNVALFNPKGFIAQQQHNLMMFTMAVLFVIAIPSMFLLFFTAWRYRESNMRAKHDPAGHGGKLLELTMWLVPTMVMLLLATVMWSGTHRLVPQHAIASDVKPMRIQVISTRWKWLFLYPDQQIATVNFVEIPVGTPVEFEMTADDMPMSSFWIPNLGGQLYTMTSHVNRLNLMADTAGDYPGSSAEINGAGFAGMKFVARASSATDFDGWVKSVRRSQSTLDGAAYQQLVQPSENNPPSFYSAYATNLYAAVIAKYNPPSGGHSH